MCAGQLNVRTFGQQVLDHSNMPFIARDEQLVHACHMTRIVTAVEISTASIDRFADDGGDSFGGSCAKDECCYRFVFFRIPTVEC